MSKLAITPKYLEQAIFQGACPEVRIIGASFCSFRQVVLLEIEGPGIPEANEITAIIRKTPPILIEFQAR